MAASLTPLLVALPGNDLKSIIDCMKQFSSHTSSKLWALHRPGRRLVGMPLDYAGVVIISILGLYWSPINVYLVNWPALLPLLIVAPSV